MQKSRLIQEAKIILCICAMVASYFWHLTSLNSAVDKAVYDTQIQYAGQLESLRKESFQVQEKMQDKVKEIQDAKTKDADAANKRYNALLTWVNGLPSQSSDTASRTDSTISTDDSESTNRDYIARLYRKNAIDLAEYARDSEQLKIELLSCYRQYDTIKSSIDEFRNK